MQCSDSSLLYTIVLINGCFHNGPVICPRLVIMAQGRLHWSEATPRVNTTFRGPLWLNRGHVIAPLWKHQNIKFRESSFFLKKAIVLTEMVGYYCFIIFIVLLTGCFCIGPGIDSRSAVLSQGIYTGPIQKQTVNNTFIK